MSEQTSKLLETNVVIVDAAFEARFASCKSGKHDLVVIYEQDTISPGVSAVVRWCSTCGSIVIDRDVDGRTQPGYIMLMKSPEISKRAKQATKKA